MDIQNRKVNRVSIQKKRESRSPFEEVSDRPGNEIEYPDEMGGKKASRMCVHLFAGHFLKLSKRSAPEKNGILGSFHIHRPVGKLTISLTFGFVSVDFQKPQNPTRPTDYFAVCGSLF